MYDKLKTNTAAKDKAVIWEENRHTEMNTLNILVNTNGKEQLYY